MRIYTETSFRLAPPRMAVVIPDEAVGATPLDAQPCEIERYVARVLTEFEQETLRPMWLQVRDTHIDGEAAKAARPPIGKALSRRARRRNRGRIRLARAELGRHWIMPDLWSWHLARGKAA